MLIGSQQSGRNAEFTTQAQVIALLWYSTHRLYSLTLHIYLPHTTLFS